ncbi:MAG: hypothetical protein ACHP6H_07525, partial [Legionellales bacterium]
TLYLIVLFVFASVSPWSFYLLLSVSLAVAFLVLAGASQVAADIFKLIWGYLRAGYRVINVICRWIVYSSILLADKMRRIIRKIREYYRRYVTEPIRRAVEWIDRIVEGWKNHVIKKTEELDNNADE